MTPKPKLPRCPVIPEGWELMKVGELRPAGRDYKYGGDPWHPGNPHRRGEAIDKYSIRSNGPYIRRIRRPRKGGSK